ncbi:hypothetical protein [Shewanella sp.]|uniref:hypothetical protein n=1 Tax=Shewanella sp. TaxID=50422 RepID=UPI003A875103
MLLKSLFCLHGRDSRPRFVAISVGVYLGISLAVAAFGPNFLMYLLALVGLPLLALTALRRLNDAAKPKALVAVFILPLLILLALYIVAAPPVVAILGLVLGAGATFWGTRLTSPTLVEYRFGYYGPALDIPTSQAVPRRRVEPVLTPKAAAAQSATVSHAAPDIPVSTEAETYSHTEPTSTSPVVDAELDALRQDELRFDALTKMTQNPADFVVQDALLEGHADFRPANQSLVEQTRIDIADVDLAQVDLQGAEFKRAPLDPAEHSDEPVWRFDPDEDTAAFNDTEHAEEVRRRRAEAKESGSMTELFRGVAEFFAPYRRFIKLPSLPKLERRYWLPVGGGVGAVLLVLLVWGLWPNSDESQDEEAAPIVPSAPIAASDRVTLDMPDGFSVALEQDVLIIRWLGERGKPQNLWSIATAKGDKSCSALVFNNGTEYRTISVDLLADSATEARFTPLDTASIITDLARRGSIGLCGYKFSLKGSQAVLEPNRNFGNYLAR